MNLDGNDPALRGADLFLQAKLLTPLERERFLEEAAVLEPSAADHARRNLDDWLSSTSSESSIGNLILGDLVSRVPDRRDGQQVAKWRLVRELGEGGFGRVYLAEPLSGQSEPVAIKFLEWSYEGRRFLRERQILANLSHEGIPRYIDSGVDGGVPYLVMEYFDGLPITKYCDENGLTITQRIDLFIQVCCVMEYAHRTVLHRDLKPGNILTNRSSVKVLDLGLATLLDPEPGQERLTRVGSPVFSRGYASPEHISQATPTHLTDIYSLGAVLYRLVTGRVPYVDWGQNILHQAPARPSQALLTSDSHDGPASREESPVIMRGQSPRAIRAALRGDLDEIILKALRPDPAERFRSVTELRENLEAYQQGRMISPGNLLRISRLKKWIARNPWTFTCLAIGAANMVIASLLITFPQLEFSARVIDRKSAVARLAYLTQDGLPRIGNLLANAGAPGEPRETLTRIRSDLLTSMDGLPDYALLELDRSLFVASIDCADQWILLGKPPAAIDILTPAIDRARRRRERELWTSGWTRLYVQLLLKRVAARSLLNPPGDSSDDLQTLSQLGSETQ
jgi:serine/threonine protein kinase